MSDDITHRLSTEGVDPLALAGVNDGNLLELAKRLGVRVSLRGDTLMLQGSLPAVERAAQVAQTLVDWARIGEPLDVGDVDRAVADDAPGTPGAPGGPAGGDYKIILPGLRRVIQAKTPGQRAYLEAVAQHDIVIGIGPAGTGKTYLAVAAAVDALARKRVRRIVLARPAVEAGERLGFLPGDVHEKVDPYLRPLYDALEDMMPRDRVRDPGRGPERDGDADEDVPHASGGELARRDHRRQDPDRPRQPRGLGVVASGAHSARDRRDRLLLLGGHRRRAPPSGARHHPCLRRGRPGLT